MVFANPLHMTELAPMEVPDGPMQPQVPASIPLIDVKELATTTEDVIEGVDPHPLTDHATRLYEDLVERIPIVAQERAKAGEWTASVDVKALVRSWFWFSSPVSADELMLGAPKKRRYRAFPPVLERIRTTFPGLGVDYADSVVTVRWCVNKKSGTETWTWTGFNPQAASDEILKKFAKDPSVANYYSDIRPRPRVPVSHKIEVVKEPVAAPPEKDPAAPVPRRKWFGIF
jgi:hypothetical protein